VLRTSRRGRLFVVHSGTAAQGSWCQNEGGGIPTESSFTSTRSTHGLRALDG
jgi:hypothetical protein